MTAVMSSCGNVPAVFSFFFSVKNHKIVPIKQTKQRLAHHTFFVDFI